VNGAREKRATPSYYKIHNLLSTIRFPLFFLPAWPGRGQKPARLGGETLARRVFFPFSFFLISPGKTAAVVLQWRQGAKYAEICV
jgi:hypothetical protein